MIFVRIILILLFFSSGEAKELQKVSLQFQWLDQFQFAGYYMAKEKGFYKSVGLDVEFKKFTNNKIPVNEVVQNYATYGVGRSSLIVDRSKGLNVVLLNAIFQTSPHVLIALKNNEKKSLKDFKHKKIMLTSSIVESVSFRAMLAKEGVKLADMELINHSFKIDDLINHKTDLMASYLSNEVFRLKEKGIAFDVYDPKDYGFDSYSDILFTSENEVMQNKQRVIDMNEASLRGWRYAFEHIDETINVILKKYNPQNKSRDELLYEANVLKKMAYFQTDNIGEIKISKLKRIYDLYNVMGMVSGKIDYNKFVFQSDVNLNLSTMERAYIKDKKVVNICVRGDRYPYEAMENGKYIGLSADFLRLYTNKLGLDLNFISANNYKDERIMLNSKVCDIKPVFEVNHKTGKHYKPTSGYFSDNLALVTRLDIGYIQNLALMKKDVAVLKGFKHLICFMHKNYPNIKLIEVENITEALGMVSNGDVFGYIDVSLVASYNIQKDFADSLKISKTFKNFDFGFGVLAEDELLRSSLDKIMFSSSKAEKTSILNHWLMLNVKYEKHIDYKLIYQIVVFFSIILLIVLYFLFKQDRLKRELQKSKEQLEKYNNELNNAINIATQKLKIKNIKLEELLVNFKDLLDITMEGIVISDKDTKIIKINEACVKLFNAPDKEFFIGKSIIEFLPKYELPKLQKSLEQQIEVPINYDLKKVDGTIFPTIASGRDMVVDGENVRVSVIIDLTKIKQQEQQLFTQSRMAQMGEMISMIAHQWRQPLTAISSSSLDLSTKIELESFDLDTKEGKQQTLQYMSSSLKNIDELVQNLTATIDDFRNFYKPNKKKELSPLKKPLLNSYNIFKATLNNSNIEVLQDCQSVKELNLYTNELMQVILNIFQNSNDNFTINNSNDKKIWISTKDKDGYSSIEICDNGGGIAPEIIDKIFDPYFSTKNEKNGTGLGLYMSKIIIQDHLKGDISVKNKNNGVCFMIKLRW